MFVSDIFRFFSDIMSRNFPYRFCDIRKKFCDISSHDVTRENFFRPETIFYRIGRLEVEIRFEKRIEIDLSYIFDEPYHMVHMKCFIQ